MPSPDAPTRSRSRPSGVAAGELSITGDPERPTTIPRRTRTPLAQETERNPPGFGEKGPMGRDTARAAGSIPASTAAEGRVLTPEEILFLPLAVRESSGSGFTIGLGRVSLWFGRLAVAIRTSAAAARAEPQRQMRFSVRRSKPEDFLERLSRVAVPARFEKNEPEVEQQRNRLGMLREEVARHRLGLVELAQMEERDREIEQDFGVARAQPPRFLELAPRGLVISARHLLLATVQVKEKEPVVEEWRGSEGPRRLGSPRGRHSAPVRLSAPARAQEPGVP